LTTIGRLIVLGPEGRTYRVVGTEPRTLRGHRDPCYAAAAAMCRAAGHDPRAIVQEEGARHGPTYPLVAFWKRKAMERLGR
jgi:hypothetical protein